MTLAVREVVTPTFTFVPKLQGTDLCCALTGTADLVAVEPLQDFLKELREDVARLRPPRVEVDVRALLFINSSCLKAFVNLVFFLREAAHTPLLEFVTDGKLTWQERALAPLRRMSPSTVSIRIL